MKKQLAFFAFTLLVTAALQAQLEVKPGNQPPFTPENLVTNFMTGAGINILNVTFNGNPQAVGYFSGGDTVIGLDRGIVLSTGSAQDAVQSGNFFANSYNLNSDSEPYLEAIATDEIYDVAVYKITFQPGNDSVRFRYVFASEEYPEYTCSFFNDVMGFFLEGPGYPAPVNIALIPGTSLPVSINNINGGEIIYWGNGDSSIQCPPAFQQYYHNNDTSQFQPAYDGFLDPFVAQAAVEPCGIYTLTIAIADVLDAAFDSGVFIEANSFGSTTWLSSSLSPGPNVLPEAGSGLPVEIAFMQTPPEVLPVTVTFEGDALNGIDYEVNNSVFTITGADTILQFSITPVADSLAETIETLIVKLEGSNCFVKTYEIFIADEGIIFKAIDTLTLVNGSLNIGESFQILPQGEHTFSNETDKPVAQGAPAVSQVTVAGIYPTVLENPDIIESVCFDIDHEYTGDLMIYLMSPGGKYMELTSNNGGSGDNYVSTCFSPSATDPINFNLPFAPATAAPFTGTFQPEGKWSDLAGSEMNGEWKLYVVDEQTGYNGVLKNWEITFNNSGGGNFGYLWSTGETTATINVQQPGWYTVTITANGSSFEKQYFIKSACGTANLAFTICQNDTVAVNNIAYHAGNPGGVQYIPVGGGCDSVVVVQLQFLPVAQTIVEAEICAGETYSFQNQTLTQTGEYVYNFPGVNSCDSIVTLRLQAHPAAETFLSAIIQPGGVFEAGGVSFSEAGDYTLTLDAANGCDSILYIHIDIATGTTQGVYDPQNVKLSPNPAGREVVVQWHAAMAIEKITVTDTSLRPVFEKQKTGMDNTIKIDVTNWSSGIYLVRLSGREGNIVHKLIKI